MNTDTDHVREAVEDPTFYVRLCAFLSYPAEEVAEQLVEGWGIAPDVALACARKALRDRQELDLGDSFEGIEAEFADA